MSQVDLRERLVEVAIAQCVIRSIALVAGAETKEGSVGRCISIGKRLAILVARLEPKSSRHSASHFNHACVKPALLAVIKLEAEAECGWTVVEEVNGPACRSAVVPCGSGVRKVIRETNHVRIGH